MNRAFEVKPECALRALSFKLPVAWGPLAHSVSNAD
jgi:hypothetical protein